MVNTFSVAQSDFLVNVKYYADGNGFNTDFTSTEAANFQAIDDYEQVADSTVDTTYNYSSATSGSDYYKIYDARPFSFSYPTGVISYVKIHSRVRYDNSSNSDFVPNVKLSISDDAGVTENHSKNIPVVDSFVNYSYSWGNNPRTDVAWVWADVDGIQAGITFGDVSENGFNYGLLDTQDDNDEYEDVWCDDTYVYVACGTGGLSAYTFNGSALSLSTSTDDGGYYYSVCGDGTYLYTASGTGGVRAYSFVGGTFVLLDEIDNANETIFSVYHDGTYLYTAVSNPTAAFYGVRAYTFDGTTLTEVDEYNVGIYGTNVTGDGTYIYFSCASALYALSFNGTTVSLSGSSSIIDAVYSFCKDGYIYSACGNVGLTISTFDGSSFDYLDGAIESGSYYNVWADDYYIYVNCKLDGTRIYKYDADDEELIYIKAQDDGGEYYGISGYGDYIFTACYNDGLRAYTKISNVSISQEYLEVGYLIDVTTNLPKPDEISSNHTKNIQMINFWNGEREVYSLSRTSKTLVLSGTDWQDTACATMLEIRAMGKNGGSVVIAGLNMYIFNETYKIRSFGWKEVSKTPAHYDWLLELEYVD